MKFEDKRVGNVLRIIPKYTDHIGIEVETEGRHLPMLNTETWKTENDASLRKTLDFPDAYEYVLQTPVPFDKTADVLAEMKEAFKSKKSVIKDSVSAGVHVHINVSDLTVTQMFNLVSLYLVVEDLLVSKCGDTRVGNLFCLRACDAEYLIDVISLAIKENDLSLFHTDDLRYASINLKALGDYGSIEFRAWRSDGDLDGIAWWCSLLQHLKALAKQVDNPSQIVHDVSALRPEGFYQRILGEFAKDIPWEESFGQSINHSVRRVQQFAYLGDW